MRNSQKYEYEICKKKLQKMNEKYEKKKAFCDFVNMKYEKFNGQIT